MLDRNSEDKTTTESTSSGSGKVDPAFGYFGSKNRLATRIASMLPPHAAWVEAFCGSAAVTLSKAPCNIEVINDLDDQIVNLFRQLRTNSDELLRQIALTPYAREEYRVAKHEKPPRNGLEKARRFLVRSMMSVNGCAGSNHAGFSFSDSFQRGGREARVNRWYQLPERLTEVVERLRSVRVEKMDALKLVENYADRPGTLLYLDPPYLTDRRHSYAKDANEEKFHEELLSISKSARCMILISGYSHPVYSRMLTRSSGWATTRLTAKTRGTGGVDIGREEVLWMNEPFQRARKNNRVPVSLSAKERFERKINPRRVKR